MHPRQGIASLLFSLGLAISPGCDDSPAPEKAAPVPVAPPVPAFSPANDASNTRVLAELKQDGAPAVPTPAEEDAAWKAPYFNPLVPSRTDGQPTFSNIWFLNNKETWDAVLHPLKGKPNLRYLEVGVFEGRSFIWMFEEVLTDPGSSAVAIDLFGHEGLEERFRENLERAGVTDRTTVIKDYSNLALRPLEPNSFDVIYIDGSHAANNALRDALLAWDLLKEGGILIFDDYSLTPRFPTELRPGPMIDAFVTAMGKEIEILNRGWQLMLRKRPNDCWDECSRLGPYRYHWNYDKADEAGSGDLFDPRTKARVPLTQAEAALVEELLKSQPFGNPDLWPEGELWESAEMKALIAKLNL